MTWSQDVKHAAKLAGIYDEICRFEKSFDTKIGEVLPFRGSETENSHSSSINKKTTTTYFR